MGTEQNDLELKLVIDPGASGDPARADDLARRLNRELRELDGVAIKPAPAGPLPKGAKAGFAAELGAMVISIGPSVVKEAVQFLQSWVSRPGNTGIKVKIQDKDGRVFEIEGGQSIDEVVKLLRVARKM